jgi:hypothetical protein
VSLYQTSSKDTTNKGEQHTKDLDLSEKTKAFYRQKAGFIDTGSRFQYCL